jgi:hypothetical protein
MAPPLLVALRAIDAGWSTVSHPFPVERLRLEDRIPLRVIKVYASILESTANSDSLCRRPVNHAAVDLVHEPWTYSTYFPLEK